MNIDPLCKLYKFQPLTIVIFYSITRKYKAYDPKERDLMFIGGGVANVWNKPHEETLFYKGY